MSAGSEPSDRPSDGAPAHEPTPLPLPPPPGGAGQPVGPPEPGFAAAGDAPPGPDLPPVARPRRSAGRQALRFLRELVVLLVVSIAVAGLIKTFLFQVFFIPSGSMEQTLLIGDRVGVNKLSYRFGDVERGQVVVFRGPESWTPEVSLDESSTPADQVVNWLRGLVGLPTSERDFIKRVIGVGGDVVQCCDAQGRVTVNGVPLDEPYVYENSPVAQRAFGPVTVPDGRLFMMGDHRGLSADSRFHLDDGVNGTVAVDDVIGRAFVIIWPVPQWGTLPTPETFEAVPAPSAAADPTSPSGPREASRPAVGWE